MYKKATFHSVVPQAVELEPFGQPERDGSRTPTTTFASSENTSMLFGASAPNRNTQLKMSPQRNYLQLAIILFAVVFNMASMLCPSALIKFIHSFKSDLEITTLGVLSEFEGKDPPNQGKVGVGAPRQSLEASPCKSRITSSTLAE